MRASAHLAWLISTYTMAARMTPSRLNCPRWLTRALVAFTACAAFAALTACGTDDATQTPADTAGADAATAPDTSGATTEDTSGEDTSGATAEDTTEGTAGDDTADTSGATTEDTAGEDTAGDDAADTTADTADTTPPPPPLLDRYPFMSATAYPESVAFDPSERAFYTGSLGDGTITRTAADGEQSTFFGGNEAGEWLVLGLEVDAQRRRLWACAAFSRELTASELWVFDLVTGERTWQASLEDIHPGAVCSDLDLSADGTAFASDRASGNIYLMDADAQSIEVWTWNPLLEPGLIGQNSVARTSDGAYLMIVKFLPAQLMRVSVTNPADVREVTLTRDGVVFTSGADGVTVLDDAVYVVTGSEIIRATALDAIWDTAQAVPIPYRDANGQVMDGFSGVAVAEGALYASKSDVLRFAGSLPPHLPFILHRIEPSAFDAAP